MPIDLARTLWEKAWRTSSPARSDAWRPGGPTTPFASTHNRRWRSRSIGPSLRGARLYVIPPRTHELADLIALAKETVAEWPFADARIKVLTHYADISLRDIEIRDFAREEAVPDSLATAEERA